MRCVRLDADVCVNMCVGEMCACACGRRCIVCGGEVCECGLGFMCVCLCVYVCG